ncbi:MULTISPECIES: hypothetical protein [unclassified Rickettsia]|uniref:hypothetical protein n=1 Tax=unclassified Rickettsia TaxID=114295 RepID=UPI003132CB60
MQQSRSSHGVTAKHFAKIRAIQQRRICAERGNLENNKFHNIFCYFFLDCHVGTTSLLAMTILVSTQQCLLAMTNFMDLYRLS